MKQNVKSVEEGLSYILGTQSFYKVETIQSLWAGYGEIARYRFTSSTQSKLKSANTFIVKHICPPKQVKHPRGWAGSFSHQRKLNSYKVEMNFYKDFADQCDHNCQVPMLLGMTSFKHRDGLTQLIVMTDLDSNGFSTRASGLTIDQTKLCLRWLAHFHAKFLKISTETAHEGLWPIGTYWHLETRHEEWLAMPDTMLKSNAAKIDNILKQCKYQTLVHGDAKVANFCFNKKFTDVAAVDFQYVGTGVGVKDVIYLLGSCLTEIDCESNFSVLLHDYFSELARAIELYQPNIDALLVIKEWQKLVFFAWADFERFLVGWAPEHTKRNRFSEKITQTALNYCNDPAYLNV
ncbi:oxidoreductase family protein [Shewanella sp. 0m-8]